MSKNNNLYFSSDKDNEIPKDEWKKEWKNMPEFISEDKRPIQTIKISFESYEDVKEFAKRLNINVTQKTDSSWFPPRKRDNEYIYVNKYWGEDDAE